MAQINCSVKNRYLSVKPAVNVTTGSIGSIQCSFAFDEEWDGLQKTAIFKASDGQTYPVLIIDGACTVPNEAIADGCYITMGVMGTRDGNVVVATEWKNGDLNTGCYTAIAPPSEDIYLQILREFSTSTARVEAAAQKVQQAADEINASLPAIHQDAETAKAKAAEATAAAGEAAKSRDKAKEYQDVAQASAADALASAQAATESEENTAAMQSNVQGLANQVAADKADVAAKAQTVAAQAQQVQETAEGFPAVADAAKNAVTAEGTKQVGLVSGEGTKQVKAVADKGVEQVAAVNEAGAAQISAATAQADRAQQEADRAEQEANRAESIDAYTKVDSRQQFANEFAGEESGVVVSLSDAAQSTLLRKAAIQGETTEVLANPEVEKSPDNIASISGVEPTKLAACGKNLFDMDDFFSGETRTFRGITYTKTPDGILTNGTAEGMSYVDPYNMTSALKVGKTYTVSANDPKIVPRFEIIREGTSNLYKEKHTVDGTETKINVYFYFADGTAVSNLVVQFQLEEGAAATAYEPYFGTDYPLPTLEPLMSLPNGVCDEYDAVTGVETRRIGKLALNGTETFTVGTHSNGQAYASFVIPVHAKADSLPISTHYLASQWTNANNRIYVPSYMGFVITDSRFTSKAIAAEILAAQYAAGMPVTVYYELSEPIIIQHTPTAIPAIYPTTTVYSDQGDISVTYNRDSNQIYGELVDSLEGKVDKETGKGLSANDYTTAEKQKLAGIAQNANNYTHPTTSGNKHIPSGGEEKQILRFDSDGTAKWDNEIDAYPKEEIDHKMDAVNAMMVQILIKCYGVKEAMRRFVSAYADGGEDLSPIVGQFFEAAASTIGETYTSQFPKYSAGTSTEGIKLDDNAGLVCTPSTIAAAGQDDYADLPLFACFDVNYTIDGTSLEPVILAIKDIYGGFTKAPANSFVGVMQMTGWVRRTSTETTKTVEYKAQRADGFEPLPEAVRAIDSTVRPFVIHAKYTAGFNSAGLFSSVSGVQPASLRTGSAGSTSISHNGQIAKWREWGDQYCGSSLCDIAFVQLMLEIKYAVLGSAQIMTGCRSYSASYQAAVAETGVTRILLTAANAAYFIIGSCVSLGSTNDRAKATAYDVCDITKILTIEDVMVDGTAYKAINLDTETPFNTTVETYITPQPWRTGSTDDVPGNDGSPYSNTNSKEPCKIQGIEIMLGLYEVLADVTLNQDTEKYTVYANRKASEIASDGSGANPAILGTITKDATANWDYVAELNWDENSPESYMLGKTFGASPSTGYRAGVYRDGVSTTGWREWMVAGYLNYGSISGFACAHLINDPSYSYWNISARACGSGGNRGEVNHTV